MRLMFQKANSLTDMWTIRLKFCQNYLILCIIYWQKSIISGNDKLIMAIIKIEVHYLHKVNNIHYLKFVYCSWNLSLSFNKLNSNYLNQNDAEGQFLALQSGLVDVGLNLNQLTSKINAVDVIPSICKFRLVHK